MKLVPFSTNSYTSDTHFIVDDEDFEKVSKFKWRVSHDSGGGRLTPQYAVRRKANAAERRAGSPQDILVHRFVMGVGLKYAKQNEEVDHINRNPFDNRKSNLRICSKHVNQRNKGNNSKMGFGLWGATYNKTLKHTKKWQANFHIKGKTTMAGYFGTEIEAHEAAVKRYKEVTGNDPAIV